MSDGGTTTRSSDLSTLRQWRTAKLRPSVVDDTQSDESLGMQKLRADIARLLAVAEGQQLENATAKGELVARVDVERWAAAVFTAFRESKIAISDAVANMLPPDVRELVRSELDRLEREALRQARLKIEEFCTVANEQPTEGAAT